MNLPDPSDIVEVFFAIALGLGLIILIVGSIWSSLYADLVLLYAIRSGKYVVQIKEEDGDIHILVGDEEELRHSKKLRKEFYREEEES